MSIAPTAIAEPILRCTISVSDKNRGRTREMRSRKKKSNRKTSLETKFTMLPSLESSPPGAAGVCEEACGAQAVRNACVPSPSHRKVVQLMMDENLCECYEGQAERGRQSRPKVVHLKRRSQPVEKDAKNNRLADARRRFEEAVDRGDPKRAALGPIERAPQGWSLCTDKLGAPLLLEPVGDVATRSRGEWSRGPCPAGRTPPAA